MSNNASAGLSADELFERAVAALVREWGVDEATARDVLLRARADEARLGSASEVGTWHAA
jgi:hypothetical protein